MHPHAPPCSCIAPPTRPANENAAQQSVDSLSAPQKWPNRWDEPLDRVPFANHFRGFAGTVIDFRWIPGFRRSLTKQTTQNKLSCLPVALPQHTTRVALLCRSPSLCYIHCRSKVETSSLTRSLLWYQSAPCAQVPGKLIEPLFWVGRDYHLIITMQYI